MDIIISIFHMVISVLLIFLSDVPLSTFCTAVALPNVLIPELEFPEALTEVCVL